MIKRNDFTGYDKWKLQAPPEGPEPKHKLDMSHLYGCNVEFWYYRDEIDAFVYTFGRVCQSDKNGVVIDFLSHKTYYEYDNMREEE